MNFGTDITNWRPPCRFTCSEIEQKCKYYHRKLRTLKRDKQRLADQFERMERAGKAPSWTTQTAVIAGINREIREISKQYEKFKNLAIRQGCARPKGECT